MDYQMNKGLRIIFLTAIIMCVLAGQLSAQNWQEWFRQKKTQRKYLVQQIAALKVYLEYLKEGYAVAKKGLNLVGDIKDGNFNSHAEYFGSLKLVNPSVQPRLRLRLLTRISSYVISQDFSMSVGPHCISHKKKRIMSRLYTLMS